MKQRKKQDVDSMTQLKQQVERELNRRGVRFRWAWLREGECVVVVKKTSQVRSAKAGIKLAQERLYKLLSKKRSQRKLE